MMQSAALLRVEATLLACVALAPTVFLAAYGRSDHDASRALQLVVLALSSAALLIASLRDRGRTAWQPSAWAAGLAALTLASTVASAVPTMASREVALMTGLAAMVASAADSFARHGFAGARVAVLAGSGVYAFVLFALVAASAIGGQAITWPALTVGYDNYRFFNHVQTVALPLLALQVIGAPRGGRVWWVAWFTMSIYWVFVVCSGARGTALAIAAGVAVAFGTLGVRAVWPLARALLAGLLVGLIVYGLVFHLLPRLGLIELAAPAERSMASMSSDSARLQLWQVAIDQIRSSPWLGVGPMHYAHYPNPKAAHPHNIYLQVAAEWGVPMLLALVALVGVGLARLRAAVRTVGNAPARPEGVGLFVACIAVLADGAVSGNFVMPVAQMWIALCAAWAIAWTRLHRGAPSPQRAAGLSVPRWALASLVLVSQVWLLTSVWDEMVDPAAHLAHVHRDIVQNTRTNPRFWSDGWF